VSDIRFEKDKLEIGKEYIIIKPWRITIYKPIKNVGSSKQFAPMGDPQQISEYYEVEIILDLKNKKRNETRHSQQIPKGEIITIRDQKMINEAEKLEEFNSRRRKIHIEEIFKRW
jgi:hypothetical protein